jgi:hypothetical protein
MHLVESREEEHPRIGSQPVPELLADLFGQVAEGDDDLERVAPGHPFEHLDQPLTGDVGERMERAVLVVVRGRAGEHDSAADGGDERTNRLHPRVVARFTHLPEALAEPLALGDGEMVVDRVGETHR